jgi:hypothetical protein
MGKRTSIDFSECDVQRLHAIMQRYRLPTETAAIRWAVEVVAVAVEIVLQSETGEVIRLLRSVSPSGGT